VLITGGAGFVGGSLAASFKGRHPAAHVVAFDNLRRRGSELNLARFRDLGIEFVHGDTRSPEDLGALGGNFDVLVEASAEPSVHAGLAGSPAYVVNTNLVGTLNCLEFARARAGSFVFLSTSRVYSIGPLREIAIEEWPTRFEIAEAQRQPGVSLRGIAEEFPTHLPRSLYGATKLASELLIQEYVETYGLKAVIDRCGVIAGPGQFGRVDQGVFTLWVARHLFGRPLTYTGFGGTGKQVRDLLHPLDLYSLIERQLELIERACGRVFNVGGGRAGSTSLRELTAVCEEVTGRSVPIASDGETSPVDVPLYVGDCARAQAAFGWKPERSVRDIVDDIASWIRANEGALKPVLG
jgi:CDP-paratose 2-epimerase